MIGTIFGVFVIPVLFIIFQTLQEKISPFKMEPISEEDGVGAGARSRSFREQM